MKVIFASSSINETGGGIASYAIDFIMEYKSEHDILVISNDKVEEKYSNLIPLFMTFPSYPLNYERTLKLLKIIDEFKPEIIINSDYSLLSIALPYLDSKILKISISHFVDGKLAQIAGYNHKYYNAIIALSNEGAKSLKAYYPSLDSNKVKVIYNFYRVRNQKIIIDGANHNISNEMSIVFPGGSALHKNPILVFNILSSLINLDYKFKFYWLGDTLLPGAGIFGKKYIHDFFDPDERIVFTSKLNREKAVQIIQEADIFLLPSLKEGCPITLLEAMSVGTIPIVSDARHASSEIITHYKNGFILSSTKSNAYVELIVNILNEPNAYLHIKTSCLDVFNKNLSPKFWKDRMDKILHSQYRTRLPRQIRYFNLTVNVLALNFRVLIERIKMFFRSFKALLFFYYYKSVIQYKKSRSRV
jgi:glycosyltransferase involved in cell wall biosynthesis